MYSKVQVWIVHVSTFQIPPSFLNILTHHSPFSGHVRNVLFKIFRLHLHCGLHKLRHIISWPISQPSGMAQGARNWGCTVASRSKKRKILVEILFPSPKKTGGARAPWATPVLPSLTLVSLRIIISKLAPQKFRLISSTLIGIHYKAVKLSQL